MTAYRKRQRDFTSPVEDWTGVFGAPDIPLHVKRDDLLPFPLAGNKFRKLSAEFALIDPDEHVVVTVGSVTSNHCRTTAMLAARRNIPVKLVLHDESLSEESKALGSRLLRDLGAESTVVSPDQIANEIESTVQTIRAAGKVPYVIAGGCHTPAGVQAYADAVHELAEQVDSQPDVIVMPSGTGATQAGIVVGCRQLGWNTRVIGVSVARNAERGLAAVREAARWLDPAFSEPVEFIDRYTAGGYGQHDAVTDAAVMRGWKNGLPLDSTYTGKAFAAALDLLESGEGSEGILFWHTGGMLQYLAESWDEPLT